jgi:acetyl esterase/lipase
VRTDNAFLAASAAGALNTANAWHPIDRRGRASALSFFPGWLTSDLPLHTIAGQAVGTAAFAATGGLRGRRGTAGLALTAASWAGLLALHRVAARSDGVLEEALVAGLGEGYPRRMAPEFAPPADVPVTRAQIVSPFPRVRRRYTAGRNLAYGEAGRRNLLDVWRRADLPADAGAPVLLQVHGGAWVVGSKEQQANPLMAHLAERGWVCVTVNYRLSPRATWPDQIVDVKRALAWVKANIAAHGGDPGFIAITGGSAGGHLSSLAALSPGEPTFQPGFEEADTSVQAAVPFYGVYDFTNRDGTGNAGMEDFLARAVLKVGRSSDPDRWDKASTMSWVRPDAPPFFIAHGTNDSLVPVEQAASFARQLRETSSAPVVYAELPRAQHAFDMLSSIRAIHVVRAVDRFLAVVRSEHKPPELSALS